MNFYKNNITMLLVFLLIAGCTTQKQNENTKRPFWDDSPETVLEIEQNRLGKKSLEEKNLYGGKYKAIKFDDEFLSAYCWLSYFFDNDKLFLIQYSASDPDWDQDELNSKIQIKLNELYGKSTEMRVGKRKIFFWRASDAYIYYYFIRIPQNRDFWRTFSANIIYSCVPVQESELLLDLLR